MIYLDHNSTTPIDPRVVDRISECLRMQFANPSSQHRAGQKARRTLEEQKSLILNLLNAQTSGRSTDRLVITSGGTESNNLAVIGLAQYYRQVSTRNKIIVSSIEHPCVLGAADYLKTVGIQVEYVNCQSNGVICLKHLHDLVDDSTLLLSAMLANHETGVVQPVAKMAEICRPRGILIHTDASQAVGKIPVDFSELGVDAMTISPHKFYGPRGIGGLIIRHDVELAPLLFGGFQQLAARPGTEDVALVCGMATALHIATDRILEFGELCELRNRLEIGLASAFDGLVINGLCGSGQDTLGQKAERLPNTSNVAFVGCDRQALLMSADMNGILFSTGSACASGSSELSPVLLAMGLDDEVTESSVRLSLGFQNTAKEIEECISKLSQLAKSG